MLQLCRPNTSTILHKKRDVPETEGDEIETEDCPETAQMTQNRTVAIDFKPDMLRSGQLVSSNTFCFKGSFFFVLLAQMCWLTSCIVFKRERDQ